VFVWVVEKGFSGEKDLAGRTERIGEGRGLLTAQGKERKGG